MRARLAGGICAQPRPATDGPAPVAAVGDECRAQAGTAFASPLQWARQDREHIIGRSTTRLRTRLGAVTRLAQRPPASTALPYPKLRRLSALPPGLSAYASNTRTAVPHSLNSCSKGHFRPACAAPCNTFFTVFSEQPLARATLRCDRPWSLRSLKISRILFVAADSHQSECRFRSKKNTCWGDRSEATLRIQR